MTSTHLGPADLPSEGVLPADLHLVPDLGGLAPLELRAPAAIGDARVIGNVISRWSSRAGLLVRLIAEAVVACVVALSSVLVAGTATTTVAAVSSCWLVLLATRLSTAPPIDATHPLVLRARSGAAVGLCCGVASSAWSFSSSARELVLLITALGVASTVVATLGVRAPARRRLVAVGDAETLLRDLPELERSAEVVMVCLRDATDRAQLPEDFARPVVVGLDEVAPAATARGAEAVVVLPGSTTDAAALRRLSWDLESAGLPLLVGTGLRDVLAGRAALTRAAGLSLVHVRSARRRGPACLLKAVLERTAAALALVLLLPVLGALVVAIRLESRGPAIFRQRRTGRDGATFTLYKLRTMAVDAETRVVTLVDHNDLATGPLFKIRQDPRVTRVGRVLRRYSLDELPQLVNVVCGQMSLVGPRPALPSEVATYQDDPRRRLIVKPGLTGLWQVSGRSDLSWEETVRLDLQYVDNWSLLLDLSILWRTIGAVLTHRGAY